MYFESIVKYIFFVWLGNQLPHKTPVVCYYLPLAVHSSVHGHIVCIFCEQKNTLYMHKLK